MAIYQKCIPGAYAPSIFEISYDQLKKQGIKSLFFDLDNTIIGYDENRLNEKHIEFFKTLQKDFNILIMSNSGYDRVSFALQDLSCDYLWHSLKPTKIGFKKALKKVKTKKEETLLIGDQLMTDVFGANRFGIQTILIHPVKKKSDRWMTRINRMIESYMIKKIKKHQPNIYQERLSQYVEGK